jgi:mannose-6-phosphate isomerase-like protein (cupin superfamily)
MKRLAIVATVGLAFAAGLAADRVLSRAVAADDPGLKAEIIDVPALSTADFGNPPPNVTPSITYATTAGATLAVQIGNVPKHFHADANEIQYVVSGSGTFWLGDTERQIHAGDLIVIPKGVTHGGSHATQGTFKMIAIKTPPQKPGDAHPVP